jgi:group II intron reverse transcriptase/maturase
MKNILEPVFEADFYPVSYGFRPGKSVHGALQHLKQLLHPIYVQTGSGIECRFPYQWAIEGDIKGCFDNIDHHALMVRVRRRIGDGKVTQLVLAFLKAGVLSEGQYLRTDTGSPQGGILSPLLSSIALGVIEERYERYVWPRHTPTLYTDPAKIGQRAANARYKDRKAGRVVMFPIRYADDFIILVGAPDGPNQGKMAEQVAIQEKSALATFLKEQLHLELSEMKTLVTPVTGILRFLGHHVRVRRHPSHRRMVSAVLVPKDRSQRLREIIKDHFQRHTCNVALRDILRRLNPILRGWSNFYRHAWGAKRVFASLDHYVWWSILRWLKKKHPRATKRELKARYGWRKPQRRAVRWRDGGVVPYELSRQRVQSFRLGWLKPPNFAQVCGEPGADRKTHAGFGEGHPETSPA